VKITKDTLKQLIKEELAATLNERRSRMSDLVAVDQAETAAHADIDAEYSYAPEVAERMKALYTDGRKFAVYPDAGRSDPGAASAHRRRLKKGTTAARRYYKKGISDAKRILGAQQTPFEYEGYRAPGESEAAEGPYYSLAQASERSDAQLAAAKQSKDAQAKDPSGAYQALGDAAMRGSGMAISRLMDAAETDPAAQAILDTVEEAEREAKRKTPLSADLEADMFEQIIREETKAVMKERSRRTR
tara:strand:+ start:310 stop:1047 length:738 start_codon:yes stop_codon:yes gene_type:complete